MKKNRILYVLSTLLVMALLVGLVPAAYAEDGPDAARRGALEDFLDAVNAAEEETERGARAALYREAVQRWDSYIGLVLEALSAGPDAAESADSAVSIVPTAAKSDDAYLTEPTEYSTAAPILVGLPNPWTETDRLDEAASISGVSARLPGAESLPGEMRLLWYRAMPGTLEADYSDGEEELMIRASTEDEGFALSGDYNTYSHAWEMSVGDITVSCLGDGERANVAAFKTADAAYAVTVACGCEGRGLDPDALETLVKSVLSAPGTDIYADPVDIYADPKPVPAAEEMEKPEVVKNGETMILFTADVRCGMDEGFGYAGLKQLRDSLEAQGYVTILADGGDAVQGAEIGERSRGEAIIDLMNAVGYNVAVPGAHETDYGEEQFLTLVRAAEYPYISCNFTLDGELALEPYVILDADGKRIAFIGVTMADGEDTAAVLQSAVDSARNEGAELVYVIGHATDGAALDAAGLVAATTGIDVFLDNSGTEPVILSDKAGHDVICVSSGARLSGIGYTRVNAAGYVVETGVWSWPNSVSAAALFGVDNDIAEMVDAAREKLAQESALSAEPVDALSKEEAAALFDAMYNRKET